MTKLVSRFLPDESGATAIEYMAWSPPAFRLRPLPTTRRS